NGLEVLDTGYFVYCNGKTDLEKFDGKLEFDITLVPHEGDTSWVEGVIKEIKSTLESDKVPKASDECDYCAYRETVNNLLDISDV
ncbi:MAG: hypothetical protein ABEI53_03585, partial [Candidatus Magasanikbacteria bacterium]